jgi:hypothetical protein
VFLALCASGVLAARGGGAPRVETDPLDGEPRLRAPVIRSAADVTLGALVKGLSAELGVPLRAAAEVADDRVTLGVTEQPAAGVLGQIASHLGFRWERAGAGFELRQDAGARARQAALRKAADNAEWEELREWAGGVARLAAEPPEALQRRAEALAAQLARTDLPHEQREKLTTEAAAVREAMRPAAAPAAAVLRALTPVQVARLRQDRNLLLPPDPPFLTAAEAEAIGKKDEDVLTNWQSMDEEPKPHAAAQVWLPEGRPEGGPPKTGDRQSFLMVELVAIRERDGRKEWAALSWAPRLPPRAPRPSTAGAADPELQQVVRLNVARPAPKVRPADDALSFEGRNWPRWPTLGDVLGALHRETGLEVLADSHARARLDPARLAAPQPVGRLLDAIAEALDYDWEREGRRITLRSRTWFRDRAMEAPESVVGPWRQRVSGTATLDDLAELAAKLNDDQTLGMAEHWGWYLEDPPVACPAGAAAMSFHQRRRHLRFWASLGTAQRAEASAGRTLPVGVMGSAQKRAFAAALLDPWASAWGPSAEFVLAHPSLSPVELEAGAFSLKREEWREQLVVGAKEGQAPNRIVVMYPSYRPPNLGVLPQEFQWSPHGSPCALDMFTFSYYLGSTEKPARAVDFSTVRPLPTS